jgi:hypothetical protein
VGNPKFSDGAACTPGVYLADILSSGKSPAASPGLLWHRRIPPAYTPGGIIRELGHPMVLAMLFGAQGVGREQKVEDMRISVQRGVQDR